MSNQFSSLICKELQMFTIFYEKICEKMLGILWFNWSEKNSLYEKNTEHRFKTGHFAV